MSRPESERVAAARKKSIDPAAAAEQATQGQNEILAHSLHLDKTPDRRRERIASVAYHRAEARGFEPGGELEDWLSAEREVDAELSPSP